jgi:hypothetical protein
MDFMKLAAVSALGVEPKRIHALVWHQSGRDPWSFSVPINRRTHSTMPDAFRAARTSSPDGGMIILDLAGLRTGSPLPTAATVMPSSKMAIALRQIAHSPSGARPCHALAPIRSSVHSPPIAARGNALAITFANAVIASVRKSDTPNFDIPNENGIEFARVRSGALPASSRTTPTEPAILRKIAAAVGRAHCFKRKSSGSTARRPMLEATFCVQIKRRLSTQQLRFRRPRSGQSTACSCADHRSMANDA